MGNAGAIGVSQWYSYPNDVQKADIESLPRRMRFFSTSKFLNGNRRELNDGIPILLAIVRIRNAEKAKVIWKRAISKNSVTARDYSARKMKFVGVNCIHPVIFV